MKLNRMSELVVLVAVVILAAGAGQVGAAIPTLERNALIDLYNSTGGANWTNNNGWLGAVGTECSWERVYCNYDETSVEQIRLYDHYLVGSMPDSLSDLTNLYYLDLSGNHLSGSIPASLGNLPSLTHLVLDDNDLSGAIPTALGNLPAAEWIDLNDNDLTGSIPASLGNISSLRFLNFSSNQLTGSIPASLGNLSSLEHLEIEMNDLTGSIPTEFGGLSSLENLLLRSNELSGSIPTELGSLSSLTYINLGNNQLTGSIPASMGSLSNLTNLYLDWNQLSGSIPASLGDLSNLTAFDLAVNQLTGSIPPELGRLSAVTQFSLSTNQLTGSIPPELGDLSSVTALFLSRNQLSGPIPSELGNLSSLQYLWIISNKFVGELPSNLMNLNIVGHIDYNGVYTSDPSLMSYLNQHFGATWAATQTVAPENLAGAGVSDHTVWLSWDAVSYGDPGGYNLYVASAGSGVWTLADWTADKTTTQFPVSGLDPDTSYDFAVASFTEPHANNTNLVLGDAGNPVMATTSNGGCSQPVIIKTLGATVQLSVSAGFDSYEWSTGETTSTIEFAVPSASQWYWVKVTSSGSCEESATTLLNPNPEIFGDGFETGDTAGWSVSIP